MVKTKRLLAMLLAVSLMLSVIPAGAIAVEADPSGTPSNPVIVTYNFELEKTELVNTSGSSFAGKFLDGTANQGAIASYYDQETLNWKYAANNAASFVTDSVTATAMIYFGGTDSYKWSGLRLGVKTTENGSAKYPVGHWTALTLRVPTTGKYDLTLNHQLRNDGTTAGEIYLLEGTFADAAAIDTALSPASALKTVDFSKGNNVFEDKETALGSANLKAGEYTLVVKATDDRTGGYGSYFYLRSLVAQLTQAAENIPEDTTYDFTQAYINSVTGQSFVNKNPAGNLDAYFDNGTVNWKAAANSTSLHTAEYSSVASYLSFGSGSNWAGVRLVQHGTKADGTGQKYLTDHWFAFTLRGPGAGTFDATLKYQTRSDANQAVKVYMLPGALTDPAAIAEAMASAQPLADAFDSRKNTAGTVNTSGNRYTEGVKDMGEVTLVDGDYTLVIHCTGDAGTYFFLNEFDLAYQLPEESTEATTTQEATGAETTDTTAPEETTEPEEILTPAGYNFELNATGLPTTAGEAMGGKTLLSASVRDALAQYYADGLIDWKYSLDNISSFNSDTVTASNTYYIGGGNGYKWSGLRLGMMLETSSGKSYPHGYWTAVTVRSPGAGNYQITLDYQTRHDGTPQGEIYILNGTYTDQAAVQAAMTKENLRNTVNFITAGSDFKDAQADLGIMTLAEGEYTVVFHAAAMQGGAYMYINGLEFEQTDKPAYAPSIPEEEPPAEPEPQGYNFQLGTSGLTTTDGATMGGKTLLSAPVRNALEAYYASGMIHWKYALDNISSFNSDTVTASNTYYIGGGNGYKWSGLRLGMMLETSSGKTYPSGYWTAVTFRSPGAGNYQITLDYQTRHDGTPQGEIYILNGTYTDQAAVKAAMTKENLRNTINFITLGSDFKDAQADLGIMTLAEGEYTVVFRAAAMQGGAYMYINGLDFEQTDKPAYVPSVPEEEPPADPEPQGYNFQLGTSGLTTTDGATMGGKLLLSTPVKDALDAYYASGMIHWKYALDNISSFTTDTVTASNTYYIGGGNGYKWTGLRLGMMLAKKGQTSTYPSGYWTALTLRSPGADTFELTLNYQTRHDGTTTGEIYLLKGTYTDQAAVEAKLTEDNLLKKLDFSGGKEFADASRVLGVVTLEKGEYTIVFKAINPTGGAYMHINGLEFVKTAPKQELPPLQTNKAEYNFDLQATDLTATDGSSLAGATLDTAKVTEALEEYFDEQKIYWKYAADNLASFKKEGNTINSTFFFGKDTSYKWTGLRMGVKVIGPETDPETGKKVGKYPEGWWLATTIHSPGKGLYYLTLDYQMRVDATTAGEIYLIKGELTDPAQIEAQMTEDNLLTVLNCKSKRTDMVDKQVSLGAVTFEQGCYTLVFKGAKNSGNASAHMYISKLTAIHESIAPPPAPKETVYSFDLANRDEGIYTGKPMLQDKIEDIAGRYSTGELNWKYHDRAANLGGGSHAFNAMYGMVMYTSADHWMAFKIKSPGEGLHTIILNHARSGNGALGAVYILPADTKDIPAAMDHSNRVGKLEFYNETGDPNVQNGYTTAVGTWEFGSAEEYILVMEAYSSTIYKRDLGYMWLTDIIARKGNHMPVDTGSKRLIKSTVVSADPCKTMEPTAYLTTTEVNGQDFLFMPVEGKKMFIFNLEDMTRERVVQTPFGISRGITTDEDGIIWMVGDSSVLWRYDPYTNTGFTTRNYKTSGGVASTSGFTVTCYEGLIYFGAGWTSNIGKYDPQTDKFSTVGGKLHDDTSYACAVTIKDDYLYAGISGDKNADGIDTAEIIKIDLKTEEVVARVDIVEQFGPDEVMVRGIGIGGDTLFAGGNSMKGFVAVDINTMTLKDYGIHRAINLGTTEVIDGKLYLVVSGMGVYSYEIATDTLTQVKDMELATIGFRCGVHSSVTLSNNPQFPGTSFVTMNSTGIKLYNLETKQVFTPALYDEEVDGSGQLIRTVVRGEAGDSKLYLGGYNTVNCAIIDTKDGALTNFEATSAQTDSILWYNGAMYVGNYNAGNVVRVNFDDPDRNVILLSAKNLYHQARVHALAAGDGMLFAGTIPDWNLFGGLLAIINLDTLERHVEENLIDTQSITSLAYGQGILMGGTSIAGGTSASRQPGDTTSAVIFAYDVEGKELLAQLDLREIFPELPDILPYIDGIVADPNVEENGRFWGVISETLFSFTFNKETKKFTVKEELSFGKTKMPDNINRHWDACDFDFDDEGYMYVAFHTVGGMQKINLENPSDHQRINCEIPRTFALGPDGNLYYSLNSAELKMYPLNVTEEDWAVTEALDAKIKAIGKITLASEEAVKAARAEYDALSLKHKALVQNYDLLLMAETDLLECKVDTIGQVTLEKEALILDLMAAYEARPVKEQGYVKNFQILNAAYIELQGLINAREAERVQKLLDEGIAALGEITLEDEAAIKELRAQYDKLIFLQRQLVDATKLLDAEGKIKALRQVQIDRLATLIASIGEVTLEDEPIINEAYEIYQWLYIDERGTVDYETLIAARNKLIKLQKAAAAEVDALIEAIGDSVDYGSGNAIQAARAAYDALTEGSKKYVTMISLLEEAELLYSELFPLWAIVVIAAVAVVAAGGAVTTILLKRKKKATA